MRQFASGCTPRKFPRGADIKSVFKKEVMLSKSQDFLL